MKFFRRTTGYALVEPTKRTKKFWRSLKQNQLTRNWDDANQTVTRMKSKRMPKLMLNYRPNGRRPSKRLLDETGTGLSRPNSWRSMMMVTMMMMVMITMMIKFLLDPFCCPKGPDRLWWPPGLLFKGHQESLPGAKLPWREFGQLFSLNFDVKNG